MKILMYGIGIEMISSHEMDTYRLSIEDQQQHIRDMKCFSGVEEVVLLTSKWHCEYYFYVDEEKFEHGDFLRYLAHYTGKSLKDIIVETYSKFGEDVIKHLLFQVSNDQKEHYTSEESFEHFLEAVKLAYRCQTVGSVLTRLFREVFYFNFYLYTNDALDPIMPKSHTYIKRHVLCDPSIKNVVIMGDGYAALYKSFFVYFMMPLVRVTLYLTSPQYQLLFQKIVQAIHPDVRRLKIVTTKETYWLAVADVILLEQSTVSLKRLLDHVQQIRQTSKKVHIVSCQAILHHAPNPHITISNIIDSNMDVFELEERETANELLNQLIMTFNSEQIEKRIET